MDLRILVVANDPIARAGLATLLAGQDGCTVVGRIADDAELPAALDTYRPDALAWDLGWDPAGPIERLADLLASDADIRIVALLPDADGAGEVWAAGARGVLRRGAPVEAITAALGAVARGLVVLDPALADAVFPAGSPAGITPPGEALTPRELEVLQLLAEGLPNKAIAQRLEISAHTVKFHVNAIMSKLDARSRTEAVVRASRLGLIML
ncbi:MAG: response regulator transcription factor [Anaerolineae bacterium]|nr:response regulator transcription factor [Anaerolineae bacterium]